MKKILFTLTLLFTYSIATAQDGAKRGDFDLNDIHKITMRIDAGMEINLSGSDTETLNYQYNFDGNAEAYAHYFENFNPEFRTNGGEAIFSIDFPRQSGKRVNHKISTHSIEISLPSHILIELETRYSKVFASNFEQGISIKNRSGRVRVENSKQMITINNEYGDVIITGTEGELSISNRSANVDVKNVIGNVSMSTQYSKMNISKIAGAIDISNRSGSLKAFDINGDMRLSGSYMEYELTNISGDIDMSNKSGKVVLNTSHSFAMSGEYTNVSASKITGAKGVEISGKSANIILQDIAENVTIDGQYLKINLKDIGGEARIHNKSAEIKIDGLNKDLFIEGEYMPVNVKKFNGSILQIVNKSNDIEIEALNELELLDIKSEYGDVILNLKKGFSGSIQIETRYGKFNSSLPITMQHTSTTNNQQVISGTIGEGNAHMVIKTRNGDISIKD